MSFTAITTGEITTGEATSTTTATKIKDNFDDHESRLTTLELGLYNNPWVYDLITGWHTGTGHSGVLSGSTYQGTFIWRVPWDVTLTSFKVFPYAAGASGETVNLLMATNFLTSFNTVLSGAVTVSASERTVSSGTLITTALTTGNYLRIDATFSGGAPAINVEIQFRVTT